jgi:alkylation response protein AidB-like acyl-CoA dehydrogenase
MNHTGTIRARLDEAPDPPNHLPRTSRTRPLSSIAQTLLAQASALVPALAAREAAASIQRSLPDETIADYHRTGILRVMQPRHFGGHQAGFDLFSRIVEILAEGCAASAWVYAVLAEHQWIIACMTEQAQADVWADTPDAVAASSLAPRETARRTPEGWRLSGRFPFSSGCRHAQWAIIGARAEDAAGNKPTRYMLVPMRHVEIVDDWYVLGLRGTGSCSLALNDVLVPRHRTVLLRDLLDGTTPGSKILPEYSLLRAPRGYLVPFSLPAVMFTLARRALALVPGTLRTRISRGVHEVAASEVVQMRLGEAAAAIDTAVLIMHTRRAESVAALETRAAITPESIARNRRDVTFAAQQLRRGMETLMELSGARSVYDADPLQALVRDAQTIGTHTVVSGQGAMVPYGRLMLGLPTASGEA